MRKTNSHLVVAKKRKFQTKFASQLFCARISKRSLFPGDQKYMKFKKHGAADMWLYKIYIDGQSKPPQTLK